MVQLIKKGGLRERANRSRSYQGSENTETTLRPNRYREINKSVNDSVGSAAPVSGLDHSTHQQDSIPPQPNRENQK